MRKYIYLVRHAESQTNIDPHFSGVEDSLTVDGLKQALALAERFKNISVDAIYHSGVLRARKTAEEIEKITGILPEVKEYLKERRGVFSSDSQYQHVEDFTQLKSRLTETRNFLESCEGKHIVVVSHSIFMKALAAYLILGDSLNEEMLKNFDEALVMDNAGVSKCMFNEEKGKWRVMSWNDLAHLAE
jgi:broad specificity phosphatase PhoE